MTNSSGAPLTLLALTAALLACASAGANPPMGPPGAARLSARVSNAQMESQVPYDRSRGYLIRDRRTVIVPAASLDMGRQITARHVRSDGPFREAEAASTVNGAHLLRLRADAPAKPLRVSDAPMRVGAKVWVMVPGSDPTPWTATLITAVSDDGTFSVGGPARLPRGAAVLDGAGRLLGLALSARRVIWVGSVLQRAPRATRRQMSVLPLVGFRGGAEVGSIEDAAVLRAEGGVTLWDRLSFVGYFEGIFTDTQGTRSLDARPGFGRGVASETTGGVRAGLELRYRQLLLHSVVPLYLDVVVGGSWQGVARQTVGRAWYGQAGCDPAVSACLLHPQELNVPPIWEHGVGLGVGADLRVGALVVGYRFMPSAVGRNRVDTHQLSVGVSIF